MAILGNDQTGSGNAGIDTGGGGSESRWGVVATAPATGTIVEIIAYVNFNTARFDQGSHADMMCGIYDYDAGAGTHDLVEITEILNFTHPVHLPPEMLDFNTGWKTFILDNPVSITNGNKYLLAIQGILNNANSGITAIKLDAENTGGEDLEVETTPYTGTWADPWDPTATATDWNGSIYAVIISADGTRTLGLLGVGI